MKMAKYKTFGINQSFFNFINTEVLPELTQFESKASNAKFWDDFILLVDDFSPRNHQEFLASSGNRKPEADVMIETKPLDQEVSSLLGPQLAVPICNARFAINATNARWGSLYDSVYGTDVIPFETGLKAGTSFNKARANRVVAYAKGFLDDNFPLAKGTHHNVSSYLVYYQHLLAMFPDGSTSGLKTPHQFVALDGSKNDPTSIVLKNNGLHVEIQIDRNGRNGALDFAGVQDILVESAITTVMDFEDFLPITNAEDKMMAYKNWLGLMKGNLKSSFVKNTKTMTRTLAHEKCFRTESDDVYQLSGRTLLLAKHTESHRESSLMQDEQGNNAPAIIVDAVITSLIACIDLKSNQAATNKNSKTGNIYIVQPKMHGVEEVQLSCKIFDRVEQMLGLEANTIKFGIIDKELNSQDMFNAFLGAEKARIFFVNREGLSTDCVPSPTAATLHALDYHQINADEVQIRVSA